jgi:SynChlorMet cassette protein ScmC
VAEIISDQRNMNQKEPHSLALLLADGSAWQVIPGHDEAVPVVQALGQVMQMKAEERSGRPLVVVTRGHYPAVHLPGGRGPPLICDVGAGAEVSPDLFPIQVSRLALCLARAVLPRGVLLHGALAERDGAGILLAGPGTVGKTTASNRLLPPWRSLCDDTTLVLPDAEGHYWAHPWPTWSRFYGGGPGGSWDVQHAVPLRAVFFLQQSADDRAEPVSPAQALSLLAESVPQVSGPMMHGLKEDEERTLRQDWLAAVSDLAPAIPSFILHISLTGRFWEAIEGALSQIPAVKLPTPTTHLSPVAPAAALFTFHGSGATSSPLSVVYTGPSMNPTLRQPDLLTVVPYGNRQARLGDVVYFPSPEKEHAVVHRVVAITPQGLRTCGDNNRTPDDHLLAPSQVWGQVVAAMDGRGVRPIAGGWRGQLMRYQVLMWRKASLAGTRWLHGAYYAVADSGLFSGLVPTRLRPRLFAFRARQRSILRLLMGRREIGHYNPARKRWHITRPYRLFVDTRLLAVSPDKLPWPDDPV